MSEAYYGKPLIITVSGGKDSDICLYLAAASGIRYEVMHNHTSVDAPETVYHVREQFRRLELAGVKCTVNYPTYKGVPVNMWMLIPQKLMPPTRTVRYCCSVLKESGGAGRMITTCRAWRWRRRDGPPPAQRGCGSTRRSALRTAPSARYARRCRGARRAPADAPRYRRRGLQT